MFVIGTFRQLRTVHAVVFGTVQLPTRLAKQLNTSGHRVHHIGYWKSYTVWKVLKCMHR